MDCVRNINVQEQTYKKPSTAAVIGGIAAGSTVSGIISSPTRILGPKIMKKMANISNSLTKDEFAQVGKAINKTMKASGLESKGVSIIRATSKNSEEVSKIMTKEIDTGIFKHLPQKIKEIIGGAYSSLIASGKNACFAPNSNKIVLPEKELNLAFFHEAGHAMNANLSKFGKVLQKCRSTSILALPIAMIALCKTKKAPGEKPKSSVDKATTFIKDNAGKLTFATFLPMLLEEGLATIKGNKFAKKLLSPELAKKVAKSNALGFSSYLLAASLSGVGIYLGTKVKDAIASKKIANNNC